MAQCHNVRSVFDEAYYHRFYRDPKTRAVEEEQIWKLAAFVLSYLEHLGVPVRSVLDVGCGLGMWRDALLRLNPGIVHTGLEFSGHLCEEYGWTHESLTTYQTETAYDLVVCQSVLQYVPDEDIPAAVKNLAQWCRGGLYLEIVTKEDWDQNCDRSVTDGKIFKRSAEWYRNHIRKHFVSCGGGVFVPRDAGVVLYELEKGL